MIVAPVSSGGWVIRCPACGMERHAQTALILGRIGHAHPKECKPRQKKEPKKPAPRTTAKWDDREDSTWIDKI